jgi:hypothetical protein
MKRLKHQNACIIADLIFSLIFVELTCVKIPNTMLKSLFIRYFSKKYLYTNYIIKMYYSQCEEDIFLNKNYFKNKKNGTYIELGALDGVLFSNTKFFEDTLNWTGILI